MNLGLRRHHAESPRDGPKIAAEKKPKETRVVQKSAVLKNALGQWLGDVGHWELLRVHGQMLAEPYRRTGMLLLPNKH